MTGSWNRYGVALAVVLSGIFFATVATQAKAKPFWHDEIYTVLIAGLPSVRTIWAAELDWIDDAPPLNSMVTHGVQAIFGAGPIASRLPAMVGFWVMSVVVFEMARRRSNAMVGLSAALVPFFTAARDYAFEARGYGLMLAFFALALFFWSEVAAGRRRRLYLPLLALALAAGYWNHYYSILALVPIAMGESVRLVRSRRLDWGVAAAGAASLLAALPLWPLVVVAASHAPTNWRHVRPGDVGRTYAFLSAFLFGWALVVAYIAVCGFLVSGFARGLRDSARRVAVAHHEVAAGLTTILIPVGGVALGVWGTGVFVPRYVLSTIVGFAIVMPLAVWRGSRTAAPNALLCLALVASFGLFGWRTLVSDKPVFRNPIEARPLLLSQLAGAEPAVVTGTTYLEAWYYATPEMRAKLRYVADPAEALRVERTDMLDQNYLVLRNWAPVTVVSYDELVAQKSSFSLYDGSQGWLLHRLRENGSSLRAMGSEMGWTAYEVTVAEAVARVTQPGGRKF